MAKKKKKGLDEATITASIVGYLGKKKQSCDPWAAERKSDKDTPWYLQSMEELNESVKVQLSLLKEDVDDESPEEEPDNDSSNSDVMKHHKELVSLGGGGESYLRKNAEEMLRRARDNSIPPDERKFYAQFANHIATKFNNDLNAWELDQIKKIKSLSFGELRNVDPSLAKEIYDYLIKDYPKLSAKSKTPKFSDGFNKWELLDPSDEKGSELRQRLQKIIDKGGVQLKTFKFNKPSPLKGRMSLSKGKRAGKAPGKFSPAELKRMAAKKAGMKVSDIESRLKDEDPSLLSGTAYNTLKDVYEKLIGHIVWGKGEENDESGHFQDLLLTKANKWKKQGVDLLGALEKLIELEPEIPEVRPGSEDESPLPNEKDEAERLDAVIRNNFDPAELEALVDLSDDALPELSVQSHRISPGSGRHEQEGTLSSFERALKPFVKSAYRQEKTSPSFKRDKGQGKIDFDKYEPDFSLEDFYDEQAFEDSGLVTQVAHIVLANTLGFEPTAESPEERVQQQVEFATEYMKDLRNKSEKQYRYIKSRLIKKMRKLDFTKEAQAEKNQDQAREIAGMENAPTKYRMPGMEMTKAASDLTNPVEPMDSPTAPESDDEDRDLAFIKAVSKRANKAKYRRREKALGNPFDRPTYSKPEPKITFGSEKSREAFEKGPNLDLYKIATARRGKEELPQALKNVQRRAMQTPPRPRKKFEDPPFISKPGGPPEVHRKEKPKGFRPGGPTKKVVAKKSILPKKLRWGHLSPKIKKVILDKYPKVEKTVSADWARFHKLSPELQKTVAKMLDPKLVDRLTAKPPKKKTIDRDPRKKGADYFTLPSDAKKSREYIDKKYGEKDVKESKKYPKIKLEMLFNIDGSEEENKPTKKELENAKLAKKVNFEPKFEGNK